MILHIGNCMATGDLHVYHIPQILVLVSIQFFFFAIVLFSLLLALLIETEMHFRFIQTDILRIQLNFLTFRLHAIFVRQFLLFQVYQYLTSGSSPMGSSVELFEDLPIPMCSFYAHTRGEPPFTNCTPDFTDTLDYILFSPSDDIRPVSYLELPEPESPDVIGGLPNYHHPSDHLPIGAEFEVL